MDAARVAVELGLNGRQRAYRLVTLASLAGSVKSWGTFVN